VLVAFLMEKEEKPKVFGKKFGQFIEKM